MKKIFLYIAITLGLLSCNHKDSLWQEVVEDLDERVETLEMLCAEMNTNIASLQTIVDVLQSNDFITSIVEIKKDGKVVGYTITFGKHDPITIYHGQDGKDGADGKDGQDGQNGSANAPVIGVAQDTDGVYYWTLNGEWLLDDNGNKLPVSGKDGQNDTNGSNGQDGKNGITPQLKIEDGYWYISYDNGATWTQLGKATGEDGQKGDKGDKGDTGDSMFQSVTQDEDYVYFTLTDGTVIKIAKGNVSNDQPNGDDIIDFKDLAIKRGLLKLNIDTTGDGEITYGEAAAFSGKISLGSDAYYSFKEFQYFTNISSFSFKGCTNLFEVVLPNNITTIPEDAFYKCSSLMTIKLPEVCTVIGVRAFWWCSSLSEIILPQGLKRIEGDAFTSCSSLTSLEIPNSVNYIAKGALASLPLDTLVLPESYVADIIGRLNSTVTTIVWNSVSYPSDYAYDGDEVRGLGAYTYHYDSAGGSYSLVNTNISTIIIGEKVELLPKYFCSYMKNLTIFSKNIEPPYLVSNAFYNCTFKKIYVPQASVEKYKSAWSEFADKIEGYNL
jgi:hypothetical protein